MRHLVRRLGAARRARVGAVAAALLAVLVVVTPAAAKKRKLPCPDGTFDVAGSGLMDPSATDDALAFSGRTVTVTSGCGLATLNIRRTPGGRILRARWSYCLAGGAVRLRAKFSKDCEEVKGTVITPRHRATFLARRHHDGQTNPDPDPDPNPDPDPDPDPDPTTGNTFDVITQRIFVARGCTVSTCHGETKSAGMDLRADAAYANLVGVAATGAPGAMRVKPGHAAESFLSRKLRGQLAPNEGSRMPLTGELLSVLERDLIDIWINAGAPQTGAVPGAPTLTAESYQPVDPPPVPAGGVQLLLDGPMLQPGQETEGCLWVRAPNAASINISHTSVVANPGTHHVVVWRYTGSGTPPLNTWRPGDIACLSSGASLGTTGLAGAGMGNGANTGLPPGVASVLPGGGYFGLNAHYYNEFPVPIQVKVWFNFFPYEGTPQHFVQGVTSLDTTYGIRVNPFTQQIRQGRFVNTTGRPLNVINFGGHMHKRGLRFSAWYPNGTKMFDDYEWSHPVGAFFDPPYVLQPGQGIDYECLHDNGVTRPVRLDGASRPAVLVFGVSAEDEMCILTGSYYND